MLLEEAVVRWLARREERVSSALLWSAAVTGATMPDGRSCSEVRAVPTVCRVVAAFDPVAAVLRAGSSSAGRG